MLRLSIYESKIKLDWDIEAGATFYEIYRKEEGEDNYTLFKVLNSLNYTDNEVKYGLEYSYTIYANNSNATPMHTIIGVSSILLTEGIELWGLLPGLYRYRDMETELKNGKGQLQRFLELIGVKADDFLKQVELYKRNILNIDTCKSDYLKNYALMMDADLSPFTHRNIYLNDPNKNAYIWRIHLKHQVEILLGRGTERILVQVIRLLTGWKATVIEYFLGFGYGKEAYGEYTYGSARGDEEYTIDVQFVLSDIVHDEYYEDKIVFLNDVIPKYLPAGVTFTLTYI